MNLHPALLAVLVVDLLAVLVLAVAAVGAVRVTLGWQDGAASRRQLSLERTAEEVSALGRLGLGLLASGSLLLIIVVNHVLPSIVPGAMCGIGALQAMPGGWIALSVRGLALAALWSWAVLDALDRSAPLAPLATASTRALLVSAPVAFVATWQTAQALLHVDLQQPVSCCAAVYDLAKVGATAASGPKVAGSSHALGSTIVLVVLVVTGLLIRRRTKTSLPRSWIAMTWSTGVLAWTALAVWVLIDVAGPYLYGVLGHRCPLCFFLPNHFGVGYGVYGAMAVIIAAALTTTTVVVAGARCVQVEQQARATARRAIAAIVVASLVFAILSAGPALYWRLRFGVWITGA